MTICITALCEGGNMCVVAADREITAPGLSLEFEHHEGKIDRISDNCVIMSSGDALLATEVVGRMPAMPGTPTIRSCAEQLRDTYISVHLERVEQTILRPRALTWDEYKNRAAQLPLQAYLNIDQLIFTFGIGAVEFLVAGVDAGGGHIFRVHYNGMAGGSWLEWPDKIGFRAIGSGSPHASTFLSLEGQHRGMKVAETLYNVYSAKRSAELAPGVGPATDLAIITSAAVEVISEEALLRLKKLREKKLAHEKHAEEMQKIYDERAKTA